MTWFTFFFTANLIVMSWVLTETENISKSGAVWLVAVFWIFVNLTGTITSIGLAIYSYQSVSRMEIMLQKLAAKGGIFDLKSPFPKTLSVLGALFNSAALLGNIVVWSYIWGKFG
ncbi:MAG: hypothetical protein SWH78_16585 [Thermodesulfobacteriota bacterium]|nr:hypothetical protein [Thermodesulfobacteriota bacterium]